MRFTTFALALTLVGMTGTLQAAKPSNVSTHKVRKGETAARIAKSSGLSLEQLAALNPKIKLSKLSVGTVLKVRALRGKADSGELTVAAPGLERNDPEQARQPSLVPVPALPTIPGQAPGTLVHLERMLPNTTRKLSGEPIMINRPVPTFSAGVATMTSLQPVLPPASGLEYESQMAASLGFEPADPSKLDLLWPVETRSVSSAWGPRIRTRTTRIVKANVKKRVRVRYRGSHKGVDLTAPVGTDVYAALDGRVVEAGKHKQYGNFIIIDHGNGVETRYAHHFRNFAKVGDLVYRGQKIAEVGRTGNATGPHLHFELRLQGLAQNPLPVLNDVEEIPAEMMALNSVVMTPSRRR